MLDLFAIYVLNLFVTTCMFLVLIFRARIEHKNFKMMWAELEWRRTYTTASQILQAEKDLFTTIEGGEELYELLLEMFRAQKA